MSTLLVALSTVLLFVCMAQAECTNGDLRLTQPIETILSGGAVMKVNFIEYCFQDGTWRVICGHSNTWTLSAAAVVCRQLGYNGSKELQKGLGFYKDKQQHVILRANCIGAEDRLLNCADVQGSQMCNCGNHAWVACQPECTNGEIRLVDGANYREGRVEVCVDGRWGTVCNNQEGLAGAVCAQLGFPVEGSQRVQKFGPGFVYIMSNCTVDSLNCTQITDDSCDHNMDLGVVCISHQESTNSKVENCPTGALGAVIGILVVLQVITLFGWIVTCLRKHLMAAIRRRETDVKTHRNDSYHLQQPHTLEANNEATPTQANYSTPGPKYTTVANRIDCYDVIGLNQQAPPTVQPEQAPVEASKKDDDFYNAEEHTYAMVDKKKAQKKAIKDEKEVGGIEEGAK